MKTIVLIVYLRLYAKGVDMNGCDYDGRTALHLTADEGHNRIVRFLLRTARVEHRVRDRSVISFISFDLSLSQMGSISYG